MENVTRLFDLLDKYATNYPAKPMLHSKVKGEWVGRTATEIKEQSYQLAASFLRMGISPHSFHPEEQNKIAIIANNRTEWLVTDFAVQCCGAVLVPLYPSITASEWEYILNESQISVLFISDRFIYKKVKLIKDNIPTLKNIYCFDETEGVTHWTELLVPYSESEAKQIDIIKQSVLPEYLATIIYTSGTTGNPKGVMLSHNNIMSNVRCCMEAFGFCDSDERTVSFLPLNHIFERTDRKSVV